MPSIVTLFRLAKVLEISPSSLLPTEPEPDPITVTRRSEGRLVPVSEADDAAVSRIISAGAAHAADVQEYRIPGPYIGERLESDGEKHFYPSDGEGTRDVGGGEGKGRWAGEGGAASVSLGGW